MKRFEENSVMHSYYFDTPNKNVEQISQSEEVLPCYKELIKNPNIDVIVIDDNYRIITTQSVISNTFFPSQKCSGKYIRITDILPNILNQNCLAIIYQSLFLRSAQYISSGFIVPGIESLIYLPIPDGKSIFAITQSNQP